MRVLLLTNMYPSPAKPWFGSFVRDQADDLRELGIEVRVLHFDGTVRRANYLRAALALRSLLRKNRFHLIHAHYGLTGALALCQRRVPVITTFHGGDYTGQVRWHGLVSRFVARSSYPIVVSPEGVDRLRVPGAAVIPAGVDTELFRPMERVEARRRLGWDERGPYALFLGQRGNANKDPGLFDAAVEQARRTLPGLRAATLENLARDEVPLVVNAADVAVMTSRREGSPVAVKEALACTTPVVSVPVGDVPSTLAGLPGCAVVPRDAASLGDAIVGAVGAPRSAELRERAERFSRRRIAEQVAALYAHVARSNGS